MCKVVTEDIELETSPVVLAIGTTPSNAVLCSALLSWNKFYQTATGDSV